MEERIKSLDDNTAVRVLTIIAKYHLDEGGPDIKLSGDLKGELSKEFNEGAVDVAVSDGEMAREALVLLARDTEMRENITRLIEKPVEHGDRHKFALDPVTVGVLTTAVVLVLKTQFEIGLKEGRWSFSLKSEAVDMEVLKGFVSKLLSWIPSGPFR